MRIIHANGQELRIAPDTVLEMERANPFFNDYGEQSLPVTLPDCEQNRQALGFPDDTGSTRKVESRADASIQEGIFNLRCRMAILSAGGGNGISTSFYLNEGSFYERIEDKRLPDLFKDQTIQFGSVSAAIEFCQGLAGGSDERFAIFPLYVMNQETGSICVVNKLDNTLVNGKFKLWNATARNEVVNDAQVSVPAGFYISPQIRALYVLRIAFGQLGYTIDTGFLGETEPFRSMVLLNTNMDTLVGGEIKLEQLVPDCTLSELMDTFRGKFCCEFIPDETTRTVRITLFNELFGDDRTPRDLTNRVMGKPTIDHSAAYKQLRLSCEKGQVVTCERTEENNVYTYTYSLSAADYLSKAICEIRQGRKSLYLDRVSGRIYPKDDPQNTVGSLSCDYFAGEDGLETEEVSSPDTVPSIYLKNTITGSGGSYSYEVYLGPVAGEGRFLNSRIIYDSSSEKPTNTDDAQSATELPIMLCGVSSDIYSTHDQGTIYNYCYVGERTGVRKLWDYSLAYNGEDGLFEKFWRRYDLLLRNSLRPVTYRMLLTEADKLTLAAHELVVIDGQRLLPNVLRYTVGRRVITECDFLTTRQLAPTTAPPPPTRFYDQVAL